MCCGYKIRATYLCMLCKYVNYYDNFYAMFEPG